MNQPRFSGVIPPVPTLFDEHGEFDGTAQALLIEHLVASRLTACFFRQCRGICAYV
ncbi:hypothetical protein ACSPAH_11980 [Buttiauxella agrestis]